MTAAVATVEKMLVYDLLSAVLLSALSSPLLLDYMDLLTQTK